LIAAPTAKEVKMTELLNLKKGVIVDWIEERVKVSQFTDGGGTSGTYQMQSAIPVGAHALGTMVTDVVGFAGDTSAVLVVGDGTDADRYNTGTPSVFASGNMVTAGVPSGVREHAAAIKPTLTVTSATDFTLVATNAAGALTIRIAYLVGG
jgi:hypothetical protein